MSVKHFLVGIVLTVSLAACSNVPYAQRMSNRQAAYAAATGEPVRSFRFLNLYSWEPLGNSQLVVYTRSNEAWLLTVSGPCPDLDFTSVIGLTSNMHEVSTGFDKVLTGRTFACFLSQIRPVYVAKLKEVEHEQRKIEAAERPKDSATH